MSPMIVRYAMGVLVAAAGLLPTRDTSSHREGDRTTVLPTVEVRPRPEGPLLWRAEKNAHVVWVLPLPRAVPSDLSWNWASVEEKLQASGELIGAPRVSFSFDVGVLRMLSVYRAAKHAQNSPGDRTLAQVLEPADYARWEQLSRDRLAERATVEKLRPYFAASALYNAILAEASMVGYERIDDHLEGIAKAKAMPRVTPRHRVLIKGASNALGQIQSTASVDTACFRSTLDAVEQFPLSEIKQAQAWAIGDIEAMALDAGQIRLRSACDGLAAGGNVEPGLSVSALADGKKLAWMKSLTDGLAEHPVIFSVLPVHLALGDEGYLQLLEQNGFEVTYQ